MKKLLLYSALAIIHFVTCPQSLHDQAIDDIADSTTQTRAAFADVTVLDRLTVRGQSIFYGPVVINGSQLPANQPALSVTGTALLSSIAINSFKNAYGNTPAGPTQFVIINSAGMLGSTSTAGGGGTVTSVTGSSNIIVINSTTSPVVSLSPAINVTSVTATGAINANSITANSATINGPLTATTLTVSGASGDVGDLFTVGSGGLLTPAELVAGAGITITPGAGTITIANSPLIIKGDTASATESGRTLTFTATPAGSTVEFIGHDSTVKLQVIDSDGNIALGSGAQASGITSPSLGLLGDSVAIGARATASSGAQGGPATAIGYNASATEYGIAIGFNETAGANILSVGTQSSLSACYIGGIYGVAGTGNTVLITSSNQLIAPSSSRRYKENIVPLPNPINEVMRLNSVSFNYIKDDTHTKYLGFIAEEVEPLFPEIIVHNTEGVVDSLCLPFFTPVLVKTMQEQQNSVNTLSTTYDQLTDDIQDIKKAITALVISNKE